VEHTLRLICGIGKLEYCVQRDMRQNARPGSGSQPHSWEANTELTAVIESGCDEGVDEF